MSLFGAMSTAISGLSAQSSALSNISDNVANSSTVGFKRTDTAFIDYLTSSTATQNDSGSVTTNPEYQNNVQGTVVASDNPLATAIAGQGFFAVSKPIDSNATTTTFDAQQYYTRTGDFQVDKNGYVVNSAGLYLNGWSVDPTTQAVNRNALAPIQVNTSEYKPVATSALTLSANLPATPAAGTATAASPVSSQIQIYDALGTAHTLQLKWVQTPGTNNWTVSVNSPDSVNTAAVPSATPTQLGSADVTFGGALSGGTTAGAGTPSQIVPDATTPGSVTSPGANTPGAAASFTVNTDFGSGPQTVTIGLGSFGQADGTTQYAGTTYSLRGLTQNGIPPGTFSSISTKTNGDIAINFNNGQARVIARVPVVTFNAPDQLQRQNGQAFTATINSGTPLANDAGTSGSGDLVTGSTEASNVDIASELTKLIVAQRAYSANAKIVTSADDMLQTTLDMKR